MGRDRSRTSSGRSPSTSGTTRSARTPTGMRPPGASWTTCSVPDRRARTPAVETPAVRCRSDLDLPGPRLELSAGVSAVASPTTPGSTPGSPPSGSGLTRLSPTTETSQTNPGSSDQTPAKFSRILFRGSFSTHPDPNCMVHQTNITIYRHIKCCTITTQFSFCQHFVTKLTPKITFL